MTKKQKRKLYDLLTPLAGYPSYQKNEVYKSTYNENLPTSRGSSV